MVFYVFVSTERVQSAPLVKQLLDSVAEDCYDLKQLQTLMSLLQELHVTSEAALAVKLRNDRVGLLTRLDGLCTAAKAYSSQAGVYIQGHVCRLRASIMAELVAELRGMLESTGWPFQDPLATETLISRQPQLAVAFNSLCQLAGEPDAVASWAPLQPLLQLLQARFVFHFGGDHETNRLDKPEWFLHQLVRWLSEQEGLLDWSVASTLVGLAKETVQLSHPRIAGFRNWRVSSHYKWISSCSAPSA